MSDAFGRKRILWIGLAVYAVGAAGPPWRRRWPLLLAWRFVGGLGAGAVRVVALGTVRDRSRGEAMARIMSYVMAVFILVPVVAPALGSVVLSVASWHGHVLGPRRGRAGSRGLVDPAARDRCLRSAASHRRWGG